MHDRVPDGRRIDTLTQPRQPPVSMPGHFILRQDAERADRCLVGREPGFVLDQPSRQLTLAALVATTDPASDQSTIPKTRIFTAGGVGTLGRSDDDLGSA